MKALFESDGQTEVVMAGYEYFDVFRFLCPVFTRARPVAVVLEKIRDALDLTRAGRLEFVIVAHSFGTFIVGRILQDNPEIRPDRLLMCGGILPASFDWRRLPNRPRIILNEAGSRDVWPVLARSCTWGFGSTGTFGFKRPGVTDRLHNVRHSDYFAPTFAEDHWLPWLHREETVPSGYEMGSQPRTPLLLNWLDVVHLKWCALLLAAVAAAFFWLRPHAQMAVAYDGDLPRNGDADVSGRDDSGARVDEEARSAASPALSTEGSDLRIYVEMITAKHTFAGIGLSLIDHEAKRKIDEKDRLQVGVPMQVPIRQLLMSTSGSTDATTAGRTVEVLIRSTFYNGNPVAHVWTGRIHIERLLSGRLLGKEISEVFSLDHGKRQTDVQASVVMKLP